MVVYFLVFLPFFQGNFVELPSEINKKINSLKKRQMLITLLLMTIFLSLKVMCSIIKQEGVTTQAFPF